MLQNLDIHRKLVELLNKKLHDSSEFRFNLDLNDVLRVFKNSITTCTTEVY